MRFIYLPALLNLLFSAGVGYLVDANMAIFMPVVIAGIYLLYSSEINQRERDYNNQ